VATKFFDIKSAFSSASAGEFFNLLQSNLGIGCVNDSNKKKTIYL